MANDVCAEVSHADISTKSADQIKTMIGLATIKVVAAHQAELMASGINMTDPIVGKAFGSRLAMQLVGQCPAFFMALARNPDLMQAVNAASNSPAGTISGILRKIVGGDFSYLQVEDTKGKIEKLWWMEYFQGSKTLLTDPDSRLNKPITAKYIEREVFNSTLGDYVKIKIITGIE